VLKIELAFGQAGLDVELPEQANPSVLRKPALDASRPAAEIIEQALGNPVAADDLTTIAKGAKTACILICDITRPVPNGAFLQPVIRRLTDAGVPMSGIENHYARDEDSCIHLGVTEKHAVPVGLNRLFVDADIKIATGLVEVLFIVRGLWNIRLQHRVCSMVIRYTIHS